MEQRVITTIRGRSPVRVFGIPYFTITAGEPGDFISCYMCLIDHEAEEDFMLFYNWCKDLFIDAVYAVGFSRFYDSGGMFFSFHLVFVNESDRIFFDMMARPHKNMYGYFMVKSLWSR